VRLWLGMTASDRVITFAAGISAIPRKTWKIARYGRLVNPSGRATWLRRCFLELPTVAMMDLRPSGVGAAVLEVCLRRGRSQCPHSAVSSLILHGQALCRGHVYGLESCCPAGRSIWCDPVQWQMICAPCILQKFSQRSGFVPYCGLVIDAEGLHRRHDGGHSVVGVGLLRLLSNSSFEANDSVRRLLTCTSVAHAKVVRAACLAVLDHICIDSIYCKGLWAPVFLAESKPLAISKKGMHSCQEVVVSTGRTFTHPAFLSRENISRKPNCLVKVRTNLWLSKACGWPASVRVRLCMLHVVQGLDLLVVTSVGRSRTGRVLALQFQECASGWPWPSVDRRPLGRDWRGLEQGQL
jgi:hypothetical protein